MKRLFFITAIALAFSVCSAETLKVVWGMIDHNGDEFTSQMLENVTFSATIRNWSAGYESNVTSESDPGNSVEMFYGIRGVCKIDFNNFTDWEWRSGDELELIIRDYNYEGGCDETYSYGYSEWAIPEDAEDNYLLGFEDYGETGSGLPIYLHYVYSPPNIPLNLQIGVLNHDGEMFDFSSAPYDNVTFECWITGREDEIVDHNHSDSELRNQTIVDIYDASIIYLKRRIFDPPWQIGDTLNVRITQHFEGLGSYSGQDQFVFEWTHSYSVKDILSFGLDHVLGTTEGGGDPVVADNWTAGIEENSSMPVATELFQNYPNPFNPVTQIKFALAKTSDVKLSVYNISGQLVSQLASGVKNAGHHTVDFDGSRLNSGIYYYTLEVDGKAITKRMLMIK